MSRRSPMSRQAPDAMSGPVLYLDMRLGGRKRYFYSKEGYPLMRVLDEVRECVAFLSAHFFVPGRHEAERKFVGTAFLIGVPVDEHKEGIYCCYLVTAKHVIRGVGDHSIDRKVGVRINTKDGRYIEIMTHRDDWTESDDELTDIAILDLEIQAEFACRHIPISMFATSEVIRERSIGVGDDVFMTGLFVNHAGGQSNIPIVRSGILSAMPEEPVKTQLGDIEAYLVEVRSIGGLSGSPVFVYLSGIRHDKLATYSNVSGAEFYLLGLMHGHWKVDMPDETGQLDNVQEEAVNMGIAIVVPATKIVETVNQPNLVRKRTGLARKWRQANMPVLDSQKSGD